MEKIKVKDVVLCVDTNESPLIITQDILDKIQVGDVIEAGLWKDIFVKRERLETDEEFENRKLAAEVQKKMIKRERFHLYEELKKEFGNGAE